MTNGKPPKTGWKPRGASIKRLQQLETRHTRLAGRFRDLRMRVLKLEQARDDGRQRGDEEE